MLSRLRYLREASVLKKTVACLALFLIIVGLHAAWISTRPACSGGGCGSCDAEPAAVGFSGYLEGQDYFLGLSYGLSGAFALFALMGFFAGRRAAVAGATGGLTLAGALSAGGCFLTGCCGSPMLAIYAGFLGGTVLRFVKPLAFGVTLLSVALGFWWLSRRSKRTATPCGCGEGGCGT